MIVLSLIVIATLILCGIALEDLCFSLSAPHRNSHQLAGKCITHGENKKEMNDAMEGGSTMYTPAPIDTSEVALSPEILNLTERIAANVHDVWAMGRIAEGWTYGEQKDPVAKQTPFLVPYDELPESEKAYDRNTAMETLKLITLMGYEIRRKG